MTCCSRAFSLRVKKTRKISQRFFYYNKVIMQSGRSSLKHGMWNVGMEHLEYWNVGISASRVKFSTSSSSSCSHRTLFRTVYLFSQTSYFTLSKEQLNLELIPFRYYFVPLVIYRPSNRPDLLSLFPFCQYVWYNR